MDSESERAVDGVVIFFGYTWDEKKKDQEEAFRLFPPKIIIKKLKILAIHIHVR